MSSRLDAIDDWAGRAAKSGYRVAALAQSAKVSERQLHRFFLRKYGITPRKYMKQLRKEAALTLLDRGDLVKEVAEGLGFFGASSFVTTFHKWFGKSPRGYHQSPQQKPKNV